MAVQFVPLHVVDQSRLKQQVPVRQQVVADEILIGSHSHAIADAEGAQDVQDLVGNGIEVVLKETQKFLFPLSG